MQVSTTLAAEPASAGAARQYLSSALMEWGHSELEDIGILLVSELVTNALLHAGPGAIVLTLILEEDALRVEVRDESERAPKQRHYSAESGTGRGLMLVEDLAQDWGVDLNGDGKTVWFSMSLDGDVSIDRRKQAR